jgi:hypothetical protein
MAAGRDDIRPVERQSCSNGSRHAGTNRGAGRRHTRILDFSAAVTSWCQISPDKNRVAGSDT